MRPRAPSDEREPGPWIDRRWLLRAALAAVVVSGLLLFTHVTERAVERASRVDRVVDAHAGPPATPESSGRSPQQH